MKKFLMRDRTWRIKFCPGSSDGCEEGTELTQEMVQTPSQTLQQLGNLGIDTYSSQN